jgi:hypothetical protein
MISKQGEQRISSLNNGCFTVGPVLDGLGTENSKDRYIQCCCTCIGPESETKLLAYYGYQFPEICFACTIQPCHLTEKQFYCNVLHLLPTIIDSIGSREAIWNFLQAIFVFHRASNYDDIVFKDEGS